MFVLKQFKISMKVDLFDFFSNLLNVYSTQLVLSLQNAKLTKNYFIFLTKIYDLKIFSRRNRIVSHFIEN